jgi:alkylhydroperoxidase/carboxymuconolactone decarboxylase family protein YurZ
MDDTERLRGLALNDSRTMADSLTLDPKSVALVRLAALIAVQGAIPSFGAHADAAIAAGASVAEIVDVLVAVSPVVGMPRTVSAAPLLALALGYDVEDAL